MAISLKSVTVAKNNGSSPTVAVTTSESPSATSVGDLVVVIHFNDFYNLSNMPTPTATGSPTLTAITNGTADAGASQGHVKSYTYVANTSGAQTVSVTETGTADEEKAIVAYVLGGADTSTPIDIAGNNAATVDTDPWDLTSITVTSSDAFLIAHAGTGPLGLSTIAIPGGMTQAYNDTSAMVHAAGAYEQLSVSGATGTRSFNPDPGRAWAGVLIAIKTSTAVAAPAYQAVPRPFVGPVPRLMRTGVRAPLQLMGDRQDIAAVNATVTATTIATVSALDAPTLQTDSTVAAITVATATAAPAPAVQTGSTVIATAIDTTTALPAPTVTAVTAVAPATIVTTTALDAPVVQTGSTVAAVEVATTTALPAPMVVTDSNATVVATAIDTVTALPTPSVAADRVADPYQAGPQIAWMFIAPSVASFQLAGSSGVAAGGVTDATVTATTIATTSALPAPAVQTDATVSAISIATVTALPAPAIQTGSTVTATSIATVTALPAPAVQTAGNITVTPATVATVTVLPAPSLQTGSVVSATAVATVTALPAPTIALGAVVAPTAIATVTALPAPTTKTGSTVVTTSIATVTALPVVVVQGTRSGIRGRGHGPGSQTDGNVYPYSSRNITGQVG